MKLPGLKHYCEMCGKRGTGWSLHPVALAIGLNPALNLQTLCAECRDGSMLLLAQRADAARADLVDKLANYLEETHQAELDDNHGGDGPEGCSYCAAIREARQ